MAKRQMFSQSIDDAINVLERLFRNFEAAKETDEDRFVSILISKPGVGKSATIAKMAKRMGYNLIDLNLAAIEPVDIIGLGAREKIDGTWQTMTALPQWAETALAGNTIVFVDEFNNTTQDVLSGFQKMFSDFVIDGRKLPRTTHIIGACNPPGRDAIYAAKRLSGAFRRRLCMLPIVDDFEYVMDKHEFRMPRGFVQVDYDEISNYCEYDEISSAVIDNIFNIVKYKEISDLEKLTLVSGFGDKAYSFAKEMGLFSEDLLAAGRQIVDDSITYAEWKKEPGDQVSEYQQILWGQTSINNSSSYRRSKLFLSRVENPRTYAALYELLKSKFEDDYELDTARLPESRGSLYTASGAPAASTAGTVSSLPTTAGSPTATSTPVAAAASLPLVGELSTPVSSEAEATDYAEATSEAAAPLAELKAAAENKLTTVNA